jgi:hypothetical protein
MYRYLFSTAVAILMFFTVTRAQDSARAQDSTRTADFLTLFIGFGFNFT